MATVSTLPIRPEVELARNLHAKRALASDVKYRVLQIVFEDRLGDCSAEAPSDEQVDAATQMTIDVLYEAARMLCRHRPIMLREVTKR